MEKKEGTRGGKSNNVPGSLYVAPELSGISGGSSAKKMQVVQGISGRPGSAIARNRHICAGEHLPQGRLTDVPGKVVSKGLDTRG